MQLVPFDNFDKLPAYLTGDSADVMDVNKDIATAAAFPTMSIKGMKFAISKDGVRKVLTKPDDPDEVAQNIGVVVIRANMKSKVFYLKKYSEGDSEGARPDCYSYDGEAPSANSPTPQAKKCAICPHNVWGSRVGDGDRTPDGSEKKGKACSDNARLAITAPDKMEPMLLRVPPASLKNLREAVKLISSRTLPNGRKLQYNQIVMKIGFDREAPSPVLTFKPVGIIGEDTYGDVSEQYESEIVRAIVGAEDHGVEGVSPEAKTPVVNADELDAALAASAAAQKAKETSKPKTKPVEDDELAQAVAPKAKAKPTPPPADDEPAQAPKAKPADTPKASGGSSLLSDLDDLLGSKDD